MRLHIAETEDFSKEVYDRMDRLFELTSGPVDDLKTLLEEVDIFWFRLGYRLDAQVLTAATKCKILATPVTGIDHIDEELCRKLGVRIICLRGETAFLKEVRATAEHCLLLTMMLMRKAADAVLETRKGFWNRDLYRGHEIYNKKVGILGLGRLGSIVASYFKSMGCSIYFYDTEEVAYDDEFNKCTNAQEVVEQSDIISIHIPYNQKNHHVYGEAFFQDFDNTKWLINTARGAIIDEKYLLKALTEHRIRGAALDVLEGEPNTQNNLLIAYAKDNDNLIITPHIGGNSYESFEKTEKFIAGKILEAVSLNAE
jgi:D-3-phosphoglycerate dehydrogenase